MFCSLCINLSLIILIQNLLCIFLKPGLFISCKDHKHMLMSASSDRLGLFSELICGGHRIYGNKER